MKHPEIPENEEERLRALLAYDIMDTESEAAFDALARLAGFIANTPIALVTLIDRDRQWFKAHIGTDVQESSRSVSFCAHTMLHGAPMMVPDMRKDPRFANNPLVLAHDIRFYAGAPLRTPGNHFLGTLCVLGREPSELSDEQLELLELLADQVVLLLEMRRIAAERQRERDEARAFFETSIDLLAVATFEGYFRDLNDAWVETLGFSHEELRSKPFYEFAHPDDIPSALREIAALRQGEHQVRDFTVRAMTRDGGYRSLQFSATADLASETFIGVARDVTDAEEKARELAAAHEAAEDANRTKSVFLANMSHELRTPLNSVIGFSAVLLKEKNGPLTSNQRSYLERIHRNGKQLLDLLNDILDLSKVEVGQLDLASEPVDIGAVVREVHDSFAVGSDRLFLDIPTELTPISCDERRLRQVLFNLVGNALKFTPDGRVTTRIVALEGRIQRLEVRDEGIGIAPENLSRIFEPFEQEDSGTQRRFGGTGLGLAISKSFVEAAGFELTARSEVGVGSTFSIIFDQPTSAGPALPPPTHAASPLARDRTTAPVLIVDDDPESRLLLSTAVAELGFPVVSVDTAELAVPIAESIRPRAVLLDLIIPPTDGFDVLRAFESSPLLNQTPVIIVSIIGSDHAAELEHAVYVMDKPVDSVRLSEILGNQGSREPRVLVIDDDEDARALARDALEELGVEVVDCVDGAEALEVLASDPDVHAIVLDLSMPVMDGWQFLEAVQGHKTLRHIPVVVFSGSDDPGAGGVGRCITAVVRKDGDPDKLRAALRNLLN